MIYAGKAYYLSILLRFDFNLNLYSEKNSQEILSILLRFDFNMVFPGCFTGFIPAFNPIKVRF